MRKPTLAPPPRPLAPPPGPELYDAMRQIMSHFNTFVAVPPYPPEPIPGPTRLLRLDRPPAAIILDRWRCAIAEPYLKQPAGADDDADDLLFWTLDPEPPPPAPPRPLDLILDLIPRLAEAIPAHAPAADDDARGRGGLRLSDRELAILDLWAVLVIRYRLKHQGTAPALRDALARDGAHGALSALFQVRDDASASSWLEAVRCGFAWVPFSPTPSPVQPTLPGLS